MVGVAQRVMAGGEHNVVRLSNCRRVLLLRSDGDGLSLFDSRLSTAWFEFAGTKRECL